MQIELLCRAECSACGACLAVCPVEAIRMKEAMGGFKYPEIDEDKCLYCGKCERICALAETEEKHAPMKAYAAVGRCGSLVEKSASGGIFASLAMKLVKDNSMISGAVMDTDKGVSQVFHVIAEREDDIVPMQGSKYVQSDAWKCYRDVMKALREGKQVLFSGTPCQVSAVKRLTGDPENLVTLDLICHGVPSVQMFNEFARIFGRRFGGTFSDICFRDKSCGKGFYAEIGVRRFGKRRAYHLSSRLMSFYRLFLSGKIYRESCYECPYANMNRVSDITIGDYWGVEEKHAQDFAEGRMENRSDWSCVLVNTQKGSRFLHQYSDVLKLISSKPEWVAEKNGQLNKPSRKPSDREAVMQRYANGGYAAVEWAFIQENGGSFRYYLHLIKNVFRNRSRYQKYKGRSE